MRTILAALLALATLRCGTPTVAADQLCRLPEFAADQPLSLWVGFTRTGCIRAPTCKGSVDGGVVVLESSATACSYGTQPAFDMVWTECRVPRLAPGTYPVVPFGQSLVVVADGGGVTSCQ